MQLGVGVGVGFRSSASAHTFESAAPGMSALFSTRKLRSAYTGPCLRVRRSSDNLESDIGFGANDKLDTAALLTFTGALTTSDGFVTTWYDQSGNARNGTQITAAKQLYVVQAGTTTAIGSKGDVAVWNPAQDRYLSYAHPVDSDGYSSMVVSRITVTTAGVAWNLAGTGPYWQLSDGADAKLYDHTGMVLTPANTVARVLIATASTTEKKLRSSTGTGVLAAGLGYSPSSGVIGTYADAYAAPANAQFHTCVIWPYPLTDLNTPYDLAMGWL